MWWSLLLIVFGFFILAYGGNYVCSGASALAIRLGISQFIIGMTVVAMATSTPELITSLVAVIQGHPEIVASNVIGSNLVNIGLAGGLVALIKPFNINSRVLERELPLSLLMTCLLALCSMFTPIGWTVGVLFITLNILYLYYACSHDYSQEKSKQITVKTSFWQGMGIFLLGLALLFWGAELVVGHSVKIARNLGWSDALIGFTIIAVGTSFPEIITSFVAALRGYGAICTGNIIGSNIFNILMIMGTCALICPLPVNASLCYFALPSLILLTILMWRFFTTKREISRKEGAILLLVFLFVFSLFTYLQLQPWN
ncbi:MAG: calcium/sodium antiporter [Puniceicoccales bacterium]|jgi:cation:H+ antiporter|nr:calcium/sodium antiporter [Puniceicoccales bacterium]